MSEPLLGIDLGTTFSAMAYVDDQGHARVLTNTEGHKTTPSVVHFYERDAVVVGEEARKMAVQDAQNVMRFVKRHIGEARRFTFHEREWSPQEISALILRKLKDDASELLGRPIRDAVITVPAWFQSAQRAATAEAGEIAGLNVLSILNEPTAAAIAYGLDRVGERRRFVVFDLGGGTLDVTVMAIDDRELSTLATDGRGQLGGKDWDDRLIDYVAAQFLGKFKEDPRNDPIAAQELYERCHLAKLSLSSKDSAAIPVHFRGNRLPVHIERATFEALTADLVRECARTVSGAIARTGLSWADIDDVLLVGGATRMPMIRAMLREISGIEPSDQLDPDECVALGAALAGVYRHRADHPARQPITARGAPVPEEDTFVEDEHTSPDVSFLPPPFAPPKPASDGLRIGLADAGHGARGVLPDVNIRDTTTHSLGIVVLDQQRRERVVEIIPAGTPLPFEFRGRFAYAYSNMTAVRVEVTEGQGTRREDVSIIGRVELTGLPPRPKGTPIEIIYAYGQDQILEVRVVDVHTGRSTQAKIQFRGGLTATERAVARRSVPDIGRGSIDRA